MDEKFNINRYFELLDREVELPKRRAPLVDAVRRVVARLRGKRSGGSDTVERPVRRAVNDAAAGTVATEARQMRAVEVAESVRHVPAAVAEEPAVARRGASDEPQRQSDGALARLRRQLAWEDEPVVRHAAADAAAVAVAAGDGEGARRVETPHTVAEAVRRSAQRDAATPSVDEVAIAVAREETVAVDRRADRDRREVERIARALERDARRF